jgi:hypothetical protein
MQLQLRKNKCEDYYVELCCCCCCCCYYYYYYYYYYYPYRPPRPVTGIALLYLLLLWLYNPFVGPLQLFQVLNPVPNK